jgi:hypothetical protein
MEVRDDFTLSSLVTRPSLTTIVAGLVYAAIPSEHSDYVLQAIAANQVRRDTCPQRFPQHRSPAGRRASKPEACST